MTSDVNSQIKSVKAAHKKAQKSLKHAQATRDIVTADKVLSEIQDLQAVVDRLLGSTDDTNATWKSLEEIQALNETLASDQAFISDRTAVSSQSSAVTLSLDRQRPALRWPRRTLPSSDRYPRPPMLASGYRQLDAISRKNGNCEVSASILPLLGSHA